MVTCLDKACVWPPAQPSQKAADILGRSQQRPWEAMNLQGWIWASWGRSSSAQLQEDCAVTLNGSQTSWSIISAELQGPQWRCCSGATHKTKTNEGDVKRIEGRATRHWESGLCKQQPAATRLKASEAQVLRHVRFIRLLNFSYMYTTTDTVIALVITLRSIVGPTLCVQVPPHQPMKGFKEESSGWRKAGRARRWWTKGVRHPFSHQPTNLSK